MDTAGVAARRDGHRISKGKAGTMENATPIIIDGWRLLGVVVLSAWVGLFVWMQFNRDED
jgi:hypothetical protein